MDVLARCDIAGPSSMQLQTRQTPAIVFCHSQPAFSLDTSLCKASGLGEVRRKRLMSLSA
jgi:hypothetical protein